MNTRRFQLKYGDRTIAARVPDGRTPEILTCSGSLPAAGPTAVIRNALNEPIGSSRLGDIISAGDSVAIVASDSTRATASDVFLPVLVEELHEIGVSDADIRIVIALGIHRRQTVDEHRKLLGEALYERIRPIDHDPRDENNLVPLGRTARGTEVSVNRSVVEADKVIVTGGVIPHYYAGFGGGRKSIMPGVCSAEAALQSHMLVFEPSPALGRNVNARLARLAGNPVHEDMLEAARMVNPCFMLNSIISPDGHIAAFAGDFVEAHEAACAHYIERFSLTVDEPADLTIVSCGGYPKDINFIQTHKAIHSAYSVTKPGGWIIALAECGDGFGYPGFVDWFKFESAPEFEEYLRAHYEIYGQTAYAAFEKALEVNIVLVSELDPADVTRMRMRPAASFEEGYRMAVQSLPHAFITYVIPAASNTLFFTREERGKALASISGVNRIEGSEVP